MTETICPTCGAKCISNPKYRNDYSALLPPDLTKLREAFNVTTAHMSSQSVHTETDCVMALEHIYLAVKELLENKP